MRQFLLLSGYQPTNLHDRHLVVVKQVHQIDSQNRDLVVAEEALGLHLEVEEVVAGLLKKALAVEGAGEELQKSGVIEVVVEH